MEDRKGVKLTFTGGEEDPVRVTEGGVHGMREEPSESGRVAYKGENLHKRESMSPNDEKEKKKY